jgi:hypothetical protein
MKSLKYFLILSSLLGSAVAQTTPKPTPAKPAPTKPVKPTKPKLEGWVLTNLETATSSVSEVTQKDAQIWLKLKFNEAAANLPLRVQWVGASVFASTGTRNQVFSSLELPALTGSEVSVFLKRPESLWPVGRYRAEVYLGNTRIPLQSVPFVVKSPYTLEGGTFSDLESKAGGTPQTRLPSDTAKLFFKLNLKTDGTTPLRLVWVANQVEGTAKNLILSDQLLVPQNKTLETFLERPEAGWPTGQYSVEIYLDSPTDLAQKFPLEIVP